MSGDETTRHRHTKQARRFPDNEIGITLGEIEYVMPISEANELVGMINAARHSAPLNWAGTVPEVTNNQKTKLRDVIASRGWKLVPCEPTPEQMESGLYQSSHDSEDVHVRQGYIDMVRVVSDAELWEAIDHAAE